MPGGRPAREFDPDVANQICELIVQGYTIREIDAKPELPSKTLIFKWLAQQPAFAEQYARARDFRADDMADEIMEISDDGTNDWIERQQRDGTIEAIPDHELVQRSRLRVDTRKWLMGKLKPKKYGDRILNEHMGEGGGPVELAVLTAAARAERASKLVDDAFQALPKPEPK